MSQSVQDIDELLRSLGLAREDAVVPASPAQAGPASPPATPPQEGAAGGTAETRPPSPGEFLPRAPQSIEESGLSDPDVIALVLKFLYFRRAETGYRMGQQLGLKLPVIEPLLRRMKQDRLLVYRDTAAGGDYTYELTDLGMERAAAQAEQCTYFGAAPVTLEEYIDSVRAQSIADKRPSLERIRAAFGDMTLTDELISRLGQAIHSGRGMFLYGNAGNGKTSLAERITRAFGDAIWIPRSLTMTGEIVRLYDPNKHRRVDVHPETAKSADGRWVKIERPTIMAGGELRMDNLEIAYTKGSGIGEAPLQLKANCGTLLIDDFGRQRMSVDELLNRWIVPLEQRRDFLYLESGRTVEVPFDQLIVFSTNLEPRDLVDEAFLRRIPYKIEVTDPSEQQFTELFLQLAGEMDLRCDPAQAEYLLETHYRAADRGMRFCHPRDLLRQVQNYCTLHNAPPEVTRSSIDRAVQNYFSIM